MIVDGQPIGSLDLPYGQVELHYPSLQDLAMLMNHWVELSRERPRPALPIDDYTALRWVRRFPELMSEIACQRELLIVASLPNQVIGMAELKTHDEPEHLHIAQASLSILAPYRDRGLGTAMIQHLLDETRLRMPKIHIVRGVIYGSNVASLRMTIKAGFVECGRIKKGVFHNDAYQDMVEVCAYLRDPT